MTFLNFERARTHTFTSGNEQTLSGSKFETTLIKSTVKVSNFFLFQKNSSQFDNKITSHYYEFNPSNPMWKFFDVTSCLAQLDKLYLKVTLDGKEQSSPGVRMVAKFE